MKKLHLISKYEHQLTIKTYRGNTLRTNLNGLKFFRICTHQQVQKVLPEVLGLLFTIVKRTWLSLLYDAHGLFWRSSGWLLFHSYMMKC